MGKKEYLKISMSNLGPIKEAEIELRPLTIFIGPNNTGKTWAAYSVAAAFEIPKNFVKIENIGNLSPVIEYQSKIFENLKKKEDSFEFDAENTIDDIDFEKNISDKYISYFSDFMFIDKKLVSNVRYHVKGMNSKIKDYIFRKKIDIVIPINNTSVENNIKRNPFIKKDKNSFIYKLYGFKNKTEVSTWLGAIILFESSIAIYNNIFIFPSERTSLSYMSDLLAYKVLEKIDEEEEFFRTQKPIRDYAQLVGKLKNFRVVRKDKKIWSRLIENEILSGRIEVEKGGHGNELKYYFEDSSLDIHATSSLVKSLSIFYLFIKNYGYKNNLFIIDEPAMNLHPEAQVKFMELITMLVNGGAHFILTTHTPYIVDHLINLMEASKSKKKDEIQDLFFLRNKKAFISPDKVAVYEFTKEGKVKDILDRKEITINWETFSKISEKISNIYFKI